MPPETGAVPGATDTNPSRTENSTGNPNTETSEVGGKKEEGRREAPVERVPSRLSSVLSMMEDVPAEVRSEIQSRDTHEHEQKSQSQQGQQGQSEQGAEGAPGLGTGTPGRDREAAGSARETTQSPQGQQQQGEVVKDDDDDKPHDDWPESARARVAKLSAKSRDRGTKLQEQGATIAQLTQERDAYKERLAKNPPVQVAPTRQDPLADVTNEQELRQAIAHCEELLEWAELNRDGLENVPVGKNADGSVIVRDFTAKDMAKIRIDTERTLRNDVQQKREYLQGRAVADQEARGIYPDLFNPESEDYQLARQVVQMMPELLRFTDAYANIGRYLRGWKAEQAEIAARKNGQAKAVSPKIEAFTRQQPPIAPGTPVLRGGGGAPATEDGEIAKAREQAITDGGSDESLERLISATRKTTNSRGSRAPTLV